MAKVESTIPFTETEEQRLRLEECIARHKNERGATMPVLQEAQQIYGYLPIEVQHRSSEG